MRKTVWALLIVLLVVHQDWWWWNSIDPLVFGFIPIGLAFHAGISIAAAILWALAVKYCWPDHVEDWAEQGAPSTQESNGADA